MERDTLFVAHKLGAIMDSLPPSTSQPEESAKSISININSPENRIMVVSQNYIEVVVNLNSGSDDAGHSLKEEASEIGRAVASAVNAARGHAA